MSQAKAIPSRFEAYQPKNDPDQLDYVRPYRRIEDPSLANRVGFVVKSELEAAQEATRANQFSEAALHLVAADEIEERTRLAHAANEMQIILARQAFERHFILMHDDDIFQSKASIERQVDETKSALAEKYDCSPDDFELIRYTDELGDHHAVVYAAQEGIDLGTPGKKHDRARSWNKVMSKKNHQHVVTVDGIEYDDRTGMTMALYHQMVADARKAGKDLPDSLTYKDPSATGHNKVPTITMMTGQRLNYGSSLFEVPFAYVNNEKNVERSSGRRNIEDTTRDVRFRPSVVLTNELR